MMLTKVQKWGNSQGLRLSKHVLDLADIAVGDDLEKTFGVSFNKLVKAKRGETVIFSWIVYKSRAHRDQVNKKVMSDPEIKKSMEKGPMPFDVKRMAYGGFKFLVEG